MYPTGTRTDAESGEERQGTGSGGEAMMDKQELMDIVLVETEQE